MKIPYLISYLAPKIRIGILREGYFANVSYKSETSALVASVGEFPILNKKVLRLLPRPVEPTFNLKEVLTPFLLKYDLSYLLASSLLENDEFYSLVNSMYVDDLSFVLSFRFRFQSNPFVEALYL